MSEEKKLIFDASILIMLITQEPGWENITPLLHKAIMSSVNIAEVAKFLREKKNIPIDVIKKVITKLLPTTIAFDDNQAYISAEITPFTRQYGLSLGDRACIALAQSKNLPILTADKIWKNLEDKLNIEVTLIR